MVNVNEGVVTSSVLIFPRLMHDTATSLSLEYDYGYLDIRTGNGEKTPTL